MSNDVRYSSCSPEAFQSRLCKNQVDFIHDICHFLSVGRRDIFFTENYMQLIDLHRTFSPAKELKYEQDELVQYFSDRNKKELTWAKLYEKAVSVVVGEAGIGKTKEFENEIVRLHKQK